MLDRYDAQTANDSISALSTVVTYTRDLGNNYSFISINGNIDDLLGYNAQKFLHGVQSWFDAIHVEDRDKVSKAFEQLLHQGSGHIEYRFKIADGSYRWIYDDLRVVHNQGSPAHISGCWIHGNAKNEIIKAREHHRMSVFLEQFISLTSGLSLQDVIHTTLSFLARQHNIISCSLVIRDIKNGALHAYSAKANDIELIGQGEKTPDYFCFVPEAVEVVIGREPYYRANIPKSRVTGDEEVLKRGVVSDFSVPLWAGTKCYGMLCVESGQIDGFSQEERDILPLIAPTLAQLLENTSLIESLRSREEEMNCLMSLSPVGIFKTDAKGMLLYVNEYWCDISAITPKQALGKLWTQFLCNLDIARVETEWQHAATIGDAFSAEFRFQQQNSAPRWVLGQISPQKNSKSEVIGYAGAVTDVTKRISAEEALRSSEQIWRSMAMNSPDRILMLDRNLKVLYINNTIGDMAVDHVIGSSIYDSFPESFYKTAQQACQQVLSNGCAIRFEAALPCEKGTVFYEAHAGPIVEDDLVVSLIINLRDITRRKSYELKLRQSAAVVESTAEAVIITDHNKKILSVNPAFTEITGYLEEEAVGNTPRLLKSDRHDKAFYQMIWQEITTQGRWQGEIWNRRKCGEIFPVWQAISVVVDANGQVANYVSVFSDISSIKQSQAKLDFLAYHDPLTNLPNRVLFNDRLEHAIKHAKRESNQVAILFIDLDHFKYVNDSFGHPVGDKLIQEAAHRLNGAIREGDTLARLGGDEFIIALEDITNKKDIHLLSEELIHQFQHPIFVDGYELHVTLSIGISLYPGDGEDVASLIKYADTAMYYAKKERNNFHFYTSDLTTTVCERITMETNLRHAIERDELELHYQPQYALLKGELIGVEALLRWQLPDGSTMSPTAIIKLAEENGLIASLGEWVLRKACLQAQAWRQQGYPLPCIAVNVSALQLQRCEFIETVVSILQESGLPSNCLEIEITESVLMRKAEWAMTLLHQLKKLDVRFAIDDFGTGYSSLSYLKKMPLNRLKIDRSFIQDIPADSNDVAIVQAVVTLGHSLGLTVIAEGVETEEQAALLRKLGCDDVQGYLYSRAIDVDAMRELLDPNVA